MDFADRLRDRTLGDDKVLISFDVSLLFKEVPLDDTMDHIIEEIYAHNKLLQLSPKRLFKRLLCIVTRNTVFDFNGHLYNKLTDDQVKSSPMSRNFSHQEFELPKICKL